MVKTPRCRMIHILHKTNDQVSGIVYSFTLSKNSLIFHHKKIIYVVPEYGNIQVCLFLCIFMKIYSTYKKCIFVSKMFGNFVIKYKSYFPLIEDENSLNIVLWIKPSVIICHFDRLYILWLKGARFLFLYKVIYTYERLNNFDD